jgi:hypothetical protein
MSTSQVVSISSALQAEICAICQEDLQPGDSLLSHEAQRTKETADKVFHTFHEECINKWFNRDNNNCPLCKVTWPSRETTLNTEARSRVIDHPADGVLPLLNPLLDEVRSGNLENVRQMLANGPITEELRGEAIQSAVFYRYLNIVRELLDGRPMTEEIRSRLITGAARNNLWDIIRELLTDGSITEESRGYAVIHAAHKGKLDLVRELLASGPITEKSRGYAVLNAAHAYVVLNVENHGYLDIVTELLANGPITDELRFESIYYANLKTVKILLPSDPHRGEMVIRGIRRGSLNTVSKLLASGSISLNHKLLAVKEAWKLGHYSILKELLPIVPIITTSILCGAMFYLNSLQHQDDQS